MTQKDFEAILQSIHDYSEDRYKGKTVCHYTSVDSLFKILGPKGSEKGKELSLFATSYEYLNDPTEFSCDKEKFEDYVRSLDAIEESDILEYLSKKFSPKVKFLVTSFSSAIDELPMWSLYGRGGNGVALEFQKENIYSELKLVYPCLYKKEDVDKLIDKFKRNYCDKSNEDKKNYQVLCALMIRMLIKHDSYNYEKESRYIKITVEDDVEINYRPSNNLIIPYKKIYLDKNSLKRIIVGPNLDQERTVKSIKDYLKYLGFGGVEVSASNVPYRN